jgi:hypothetical protein
LETKGWFFAKCSKIKPAAVQLLRLRLLAWMGSIVKANHAIIAGRKGRCAGSQSNQQVSGAIQQAPCIPQHVVV